jgi:hypothetical protein
MKGKKGYTEIHRGDTEIHRGLDGHLLFGGVLGVEFLGKGDFIRQ